MLDFKLNPPHKLGEYVMRKFGAFFTVLVISLMLLNLTGCATYRTISATKAGSPKVYSGTRLNINAITHDKTGILKFNVDPPAYPWIDIPFSIFLDTMIFPLTFSIATYEVIFN
jgi:uncharacterized protein YceK